MESIVELLFSIFPILLFVLVTRIVRDRAKKVGEAARAPATRQAMGGGDSFAPLDALRRAARGKAATFFAGMKAPDDKAPVRSDERRDSGFVEPVRMAGSRYGETRKGGRPGSASGSAGEYGRSGFPRPAVVQPTAGSGRSRGHDRAEQGRRDRDGVLHGDFAFPAAVTKLPPLKQAWLFSEILGPPASMRREPGGH